MFIHLHVHSPYSFLDGGSDLETLVKRAAMLGMPALALTDHDNLCAAVKFVTLCRAYSLHPILGAELTMEDSTHLTLLAQNKSGYANLCRLITAAFSHGGRLSPKLPWHTLGVVDEARQEGSIPPLSIGGLFCLSGCRKGRISTLIRTRQCEAATATAILLRDLFGRDNFYLELQDDLTPHAFRLCRELVELGEKIGVRSVATNNVHYATQDDFATHDILRCVAAKTTRDQFHLDRPLNS